MWFETLTGFQEISPEQVREHLSVYENILKSNVNNKEYTCGVLETPSLSELRLRIQFSADSTGKMSVREVVADAQQLHADKLNAGSLIQVASQFNLLEMISPETIPEQGVGIYERDPTQGPACAIAAGAGTIYRNYFVDVKGQIGQSANNQIDCLSDIGTALGNSDNRLWRMENGYALATEKGLKEIATRLTTSDESQIDDLRKLLRIGIHWDTEVTISQSRHVVSQAYCSALPVAYSHCSPDLWSDFAKLILEASYEATLCAGFLNYIKNGNNTIYLTLIGGGAFGNEREWIMNALYYALNIYKYLPLDVAIVSRGSTNKYVQDLIRKINGS